MGTVARDRRWRALALLCLVGAALTGADAWLSVSRSRQHVRDVALPVVEHPLDGPTTSAPAPGSGTGHPLLVPAPPAAAPPAPTAPRAADPVFLVRHTAPDRSFGFLAVDAGDPSPGGRRATPLACERLHFAAGRGVCLVAGRPLLTSYSAVLFDRAFQPLQTVAIDGIPSRTRVSPNGRLAAITVFVGGHSYADDGFATATSIVDTETGAAVVANLEELQVTRGGQPFAAADFNFWGVTFAADSDRFYATLGTGGVSYLLDGRVRSRTAGLVRAGVECPAISPDNTRIAFKKPIEVGPLRAWRLAVLDLKTLVETPLAETRSVDDQVEWLDDARILYALPQRSSGAAATDVWVVPSDGSGRPEILLKEASSPAVVRSAAIRGR